MTFKPTSNRCCGGIDFTLSAPATLKDWAEALGEERCCDLIFKMQCYTKANQAIRYALKFNPRDEPRSFTDSEKARAVEMANLAILKRD